MPRPPMDRLRILAARLLADAEHDRITDTHNFFGDLRELCALVEKWAESVEESAGVDMFSAAEILQGSLGKAAARKAYKDPLDDE